jgi:hypothetical protein
MTPYVPTASIGQYMIAMIVKNWRMSSNGPTREN